MTWGCLVLDTCAIIRNRRGFYPRAHGVVEKQREILFHSPSYTFLSFMIAVYLCHTVECPWTHKYKFLFLICEQLTLDFNAIKILQKVTFLWDLSENMDSNRFREFIASLREWISWNGKDMTSSLNDTVQHFLPPIPTERAWTYLQVEHPLHKPLFVVMLI